MTAVDTSQVALAVASPPAGSVKSTGTQLVAAFPPRPLAASWPATQARRSAVAERVLAAPFALDNPGSQRNRRLGVLAVLGWLHGQSGECWQQRWRASGAEDQPDWRLLVGIDRAKPLPHLTSGLLVLICADVIRPSLAWLLRFAPARHNLAPEMARTRDGAAFAELTALSQDRIGLQCQQRALTNIAIIMAAKGGNVAAVQVGDCLELLAAAARTRTGNDRRAESPLFYQLLRAHGDLGPDAPAAIEMFFGRGQPSCEELIDRYHIACGPVRDVLVDYLRERQTALDFSSLQHLAYLLGKLFWADLETHHPGIDSLQLPRDVAAAWKQRVLTRPKATKGQGQISVPRLDGRSVLTAVRAFYLDLAEWADDDPARWGPWAVRCPVSASDASHKKSRLQRKSRMDTRTRERLPVLPTLIAWVTAQRARTAELLTAAEQTQPGELFTAAGTTLRRSVLKTQTTGRVWAQDPDTGARRDLSFEEHRGFWTWAVVEVLRHTGIRIEELTELSHHSLIQYRLPSTGELIPLLQIAPSKTDAERLLVISPELADVLSTIVARIRGDRPSVPLVVSYDQAERLYNPPMPLLFQCRRRLDHRAVSQTVLRHYLDHALTQTGVKDAAGQPMRYTFHDFRRLFITDAIAHGMPPHIAQLVAGHRDINTTMGYKAVYPEEVINGHRAFITRRRALRPGEEYRTPTDAEWAEFVGHFQRRKLAIGDCGRSYDTPCIHEHSCLRCPLLRPDPAARARLEEIRDNLIARIAEAESRRWYGEAEGLKVSLTGANTKLAQMDQISASRAKTVQLGIPSFTDTAGRATEHPGHCNLF
ncbi:site-specific integrase [Mycobacterium sp.]|uniref:tyrosine-type recombinase/integrase n=1 Tax=Mycobacterium sp. TaxID=1785 RepID=UPI002CD62ABA|nr:site-specific integrase [Mycobacterium sp.]HTQ19130.1 site-specific integrase [Mycobacterium sp.]